MSRTHDYEGLIGKKIGRLCVKAVLRDGKTPIRLVCVCECGNECQPLAINVWKGRTKACGCRVLLGNNKHGGWGSREYRSWATMIQRCTNPLNPNFKRYGALGVAVCERWRNSFDDFMADMGPRPPDTSLDRINPFGDYEPKNCRWADRYTQARNKRAAWTKEGRA